MTDNVSWTPRNLANARQIIDDLPDGIGKQFLQELAQIGSFSDNCESGTPPLIELLCRWEKEKGGEPHFSRTELNILSDLVLENLQGVETSIPQRTMKGHIYRMCASTAKSFAASFRLLDFRRYFRRTTLGDGDGALTADQITTNTQVQLDNAKAKAAGLAASMAILPAPVAAPLVPLIGSQMDVAYELGQQSMKEYLTFALNQVATVTNEIGNRIIEAARNPEVELHFDGSGM